MSIYCGKQRGIWLGRRRSVSARRILKNGSASRSSQALGLETSPPRSRSNTVSKSRHQMRVWGGECYFRVRGSNSTPSAFNCSVRDIFRRSRPVCCWYSLKKFVAAVAFTAAFPPVVWSNDADDERAGKPKSLRSPEKPSKGLSVSRSPAPGRPACDAGRPKLFGHLHLAAEPREQHEIRLSGDLRDVSGRGGVVQQRFGIGAAHGQIECSDRRIDSRPAQDTRDAGNRIRAEEGNGKRR